MAAPVMSSSAAAMPALQMSVEPVSRAAARDGRHRPGRLGQVAADGLENVLVARTDDDVRRHAVRGLGDPPGDELGVALAAAFRLAIGQVPLAMMLRGRPVRMRVVLSVRTVADLEPPGRTLIAAACAMTSVPSRSASTTT